MSTVLTRISFRTLAPALILYSLYLLIRGHNQPGGGFAGGLVGGLGVLLLQVEASTHFALNKTNFFKMIAVGLICLVGSGMICFFSGQPFMTGVWIELLGLKLGTPLLFDLGVFLIVISMVGLTIDALFGGEQWKL